jgi:hypothetical protein
MSQKSKQASTLRAPSHSRSVQPGLVKQPGHLSQTEILPNNRREKHGLEPVAGFTLENLHLIPVDDLLAFPSHRFITFDAGRRDYFPVI